MSTSSDDLAGRERRRSGREVLHLQVEIEGEGPDGNPVSGSAEVIAVSKHGAMVQSPAELRKGSTLNIRNPSNDQSGEFRVVWTAPLPLEAAWNIGLESASGDTSLWNANY